MSFEITISTDQLSKGNQLCNAKIITHVSLTLNDKTTPPYARENFSMLSFALIKKKLTAPSIGADMVDVSSVKTNTRQHVPTGVTCNDQNKYFSDILYI